MSSNQQGQSNHARFKFRSLNAAQERGDSLDRHGLSARQDEPQARLLEPVTSRGDSPGSQSVVPAPRMNGAFRHRGAGAAERQSCSIGTIEAFATRPRPNPSLERTSTGMALGPRGRGVYHRPRGPSATPVASAQLKR